jgi:hypothetical protein
MSVIAIEVIILLKTMRASPSKLLSKAGIKLQVVDKIQPMIKASP